MLDGLGNNDLGNNGRRRNRNLGVDGRGGSLCFGGRGRGRLWCRFVGDRCFDGRCFDGRCFASGCFDNDRFDGGLDHFDGGLDRHYHCRRGLGRINDWLRRVGLRSLRRRNLLGRSLLRRSLLGRLGLFGLFVTLEPIALGAAGHHVGVRLGERR